MATNDDLISRIKQSRIGKAVSNVLSDSAQGYKNAYIITRNKLNENGAGDRRNAFTRSLVTPPSNFLRSASSKIYQDIKPFGTAIGTVIQSPLENRFNRIDTQSVLNQFQRASTPQQNQQALARGTRLATSQRDRAEQLQNIRNSAPASALRTGLYSLGGSLGGKNLAFSSALSSGINAGFAPRGEKLQAAGRGAAEGIKYAGLNKLTSPIIDPTSKLLGTAFAAGAGAKPITQKLAGVVGQSVGQGLGNVAEDEFLARGTEGRVPTANERWASFLTAAAFTGALNLKDVKIDNNGYLKNKNGQWFDPSSGKYVEYSNKVKKAQDKVLKDSAGKLMDDPRGAKDRLIPGGKGMISKARSRLKDKPGFIDLSAKVGAESKPTKGVEPLIEEARKYKSAEEYVKSRGKPVFHGTDADFKEFSLKDFGKTDEGFLGKGVYLTQRKGNAKQYGRNIVEAYPELKNPYEYNDSYFFGGFSPSKIKEKVGLPDSASATDLRNKLIEMGHDGVIVNEITDSGIRKNAEVVVFDPKQIKTKSQLTDIYNQAKGETIVNPLTGETIPKPTGRQAGFIDFGADVGKQKGSGLFKTTEEGYKLINESGGKIDAERLYLLKQEADLYPNAKEFIKRFYDTDLSEKQLLEIYNQAKGVDQPKPQQSIEPPAVKSMELESSKKTASKIKTQKQKELTFRGKQPVQGGSKLRVKPGAKVKVSPSKVSSDVSITRDKKYAFNINKKKLNLNEEQSKQLDNVVETMRPVLEANKGKTLTKQEIVEAGRKANVLQDTIGREESKKFAESLQASRNFLKSEQAQVGITPKFLEQLEIVSSNAADAGRRLQSFNIGAEDVTIKEKVLSDILKIGADVDEVLKAGKNVDWNDAKQITDFYRKFKPASLADKLQEFRYTNMLSSPNTHIVNSFSNILQTAVLAPIEKAIRGTTSFAESRLTGKEQEYFARQGVDYLKGYWKALPDAVKKFSDTIKGVEGLRKPDIDFIPTSTSKVRQIYTLPLQALEASDQFFRTLVKGGEIESLKREGITGARASKLAEESADYRTFRQAFDPEGKLGQNKVLQVWDKWNVAVNNLRNVPGGKWIVPFLQTPTNILKQGFEYSPLGALTIKGSARPHEQLAKTIIGSSVFAGAYALADSGLTTWDAPTNSTERAEFYAAGLQPYSVKIGDKWVSYSKLGPLSYPIAMASALKWAKDEGSGDDVLKTMGRSMAGTLGFFADQSYVRGIGDIIDAFRGDEFKQARGLSNIPSQLIPYRSFMGWVTRLVDPVYRKTSGGSVPEQIGKSIISQIPGLSQNLEAYQTPFGTDSERQFPLVNAVSPLSVTQERTAEKEYYDARQNIRTQKKEVNKVLEDIENGKDIKIDSNKLLTDQVISLTKKKIEAGLEVTPQELETVYLGKITSLPKDNRYDKSIRDSKLYAKFGTIEEDENLTETQKQYLYEKIATELDKPIEDLKTYQVAKDVVPRKTLYVYDKMDSMQSKDELMAFLAQGRRPINGQILISDGVIDNLVSDGVIPYELGKELKKYDLNEDGTQKSTKKTSSGGSSKKGTTKNDQEIAKIKAYGKYLDAIKNITPASGYPQGKIPTTKINVQGLTFGS